MPFIKMKQGEKICIYKKDAEGKPHGDTLGCHASEKEANDQIAAIYAREAVSKKAFKVVSASDDELRVQNYIALWGDEDNRDLEGLRYIAQGRQALKKNVDGSLGEFFDPGTDFESDYTKAGTLYVDWEHGADLDKVGNGKDVVLGRVDWSTARKDEDGLVVERVLNRRHRFMKWLETLIEAGVIGSSSEAIPTGVKIGSNGKILSWPLRRDTLTVSPTEPRMLSENVIQALKALGVGEFGDFDSGSKGEDGKDPLASQKKTPPAPVKLKPVQLGGVMKTLLDAIKALVPGLTDEQIAALAAVLELKGAQSATEPTNGDKTVAIDEKVILEALKKLGIEPPKPEDDQKGSPPPFDFTKGSKSPTEEEKAALAKKSLMNSFYQIRFGEQKEAEKAIYGDLIGPDYQQLILDQNIAYAKYLRGGERNLDSADAKLLKKQIFPLEMILEHIKGGMTVEEIKTTMVEAQGDLGGYAVPPNVQSEIITRLPGLTVVRGGGATVVTLATGNSVQAPEYKTDDTTHRYIGYLRGQWGNETKTPGAQNAQIGLVDIVANVYTYKVPMSQSLVEDAANLVSLVNEDIRTTLAIDEDEGFLTADGVGKPLGILPGGLNLMGLTEVISGDAALLTVAGIRKLKRGIPSQYRAGAVWVGESLTYSAIESFVATTGPFIFPDLTETDTLLNRKTYESEVMPSIGAGTFPLLFINLAGYWIVERLGLSIQRFQDSNTGPNVVEYHVRRRVGGRLVKHWMGAVQKISAS